MLGKQARGCDELVDARGLDRAKDRGPHGKRDQQAEPHKNPAANVQTIQSHDNPGQFVSGNLDNNP
jgi:hypothetical protein